MKKFFLYFSFLLVAMICISCHDSNGNLLDDGLDDWTCITDSVGKDTPSPFKVEDGVLQISGQPFGYVRTNDKYGNCTFHAEWRWPGEPTDSGIYFYLQDGDRVWPTGVQCQMKPESLGLLVSGVELSGVEHKPGRPSFKPSLVEESVERPTGEWNELDATCQDGHLVVHINGKLVNEADCAATEGYIGFQSEGGPIEYRNVIVTPL